MENRFKHLEKTETLKYDWENNLLKRSLPVRAFTNRLTSGLILACEVILVESMKPLQRLREWYSI
ncbi:hypothetical protein BPT24_241 [Tenacibaculum phage pT24]|uniref:Uncharacterized protein n=1 Tax=Tenacibaculum phage pT24 TaxID=1880590 RepID=A0A1B4XX26_9CAUD|nr:hypothetical protein HYP10_gp287 [Tenacibaculum phage pT24]BAV39361.1 hypothetical protein BPT24_241 [Tenacibaculum phage pT24]